MRHDDPSSSPSPSSTTDPQPPSRARSWAWPAVLVVLMVSTSLAVAVTVSAWLVPPYLVLMVWILAPARGPHDPVPAPAEPGSMSPRSEASRGNPSEAEIDTRSLAEPDAPAFATAEGGADQAASTGPETALVKTRRGKGRGRKAKGSAIVEPAGATATWIRVGPGRFVRAEGPAASPPAESGSPEPDRSPELELHHDETQPDENAREQAPALDEGGASAEGGGDIAVAMVAEDDLPGDPGLEEPETSPDETSGDQGIALDAPGAAVPAGSDDPRPCEPEEAPSPPALAADAPPRSTVHDASFVSWRAAWPRVVLRARGNPAATPAGRVVRSGRRARVSPGLRRRSRRGPGRYRLVCRTFPPRSPPGGPAASGRRIPIEAGGLGVPPRRSS